VGRGKGRLQIPRGKRAGLARLHRQIKAGNFNLDLKNPHNPDTGPGDVDHLLPEYEKLLAQIAGDARSSCMSVKSASCAARSTASIKCHVLVELKTTAFSHEHLGQLNTYVAYYKKHEMTPGDQPPVGILLCTRKNEALVEFALGDLPNKLFVSRYAVEMPKKQEMEAFLTQLGKEIGHEG
jgi:hypothetical protein